MKDYLEKREREFEERLNIKHEDSFLDYGDDDCPPEIDWEKVKAFHHASMLGLIEEVKVEIKNLQRERDVNEIWPDYYKGWNSALSELSALLDSALKR